MTDSAAVGKRRAWGEAGYTGRFNKSGDPIDPVSSFVERCARQAFKRHAADFEFNVKNRQREFELLRLLHADLHTKSFELQYRRLDGDVEQRKISPLALLHNDRGRHYSMLAWCHLRKDYRNFLISGIEGIDPIDRVRPLSPTDLLDLLTDSAPHVIRRILLANRLLRDLEH